MNGESVLKKAQILRENLELLEAIPQTTFEEFAADFRNVQSALHLLQTSVQALIDIGSFLCAKLGLPTPRSSHEVFQRLETDQRLPPGTAKRAEPIIGFRNRVVHLYERIDHQIVYRILREARGDLLGLLELLILIDA
jgi:uncharacterized protein YutE (UPF0331/DUF86 family)